MRLAVASYFYITILNALLFDCEMLLLSHYLFLLTSGLNKREFQTLIETLRISSTVRFQRIT